MGNKTMILATFILFAIISQGCRKVTSIPTGNDNFIIVPPSNMQVYLSGDATIIVFWDQVSAVGFSYYNVYLGTSRSNQKVVDQTTENAFLVDSLSYDSTYYLSVTAVYANGVESGQSNFVATKPVNYSAPPAPLGLTVHGHDDDFGKYFSVIWSSEQIGDLAGYEVYRDTSADFQPDTLTKTDLVATVVTNSIDDTDHVDVNRGYYYKIIAFDFDHWRSAASLPVSDRILSRPQLVSPPSGASINYNDLLTFKFTQVAGSSGYLLLISSSPTGGEVFTTTIPAGEDSLVYSGSSLNYNQLYFWRVAATTVDPATPNSTSNVFSFTISQ